MQQQQKPEMDEQEPKKKVGFFAGLSQKLGFGAQRSSSGSDEDEQYLKNNISAEEVNSDDMAGGLCESDSDDGA